MSCLWQKAPSGETVCDSAHLQRLQLQLSSLPQCGFVYVSSGCHGPRVSRRDVISIDSDAHQSAWELSQLLIFPVSVFVLCCARPLRFFPHEPKQRMLWRLNPA